MRRALLLFAVAVASWARADDTRRSGFDFMSPGTQAMQRDDMQNPGMLWVQDGEALWNAKAGARDKSCASCHGDAATSMRGVAARYPAFDAPQGVPLTLGQRIDTCRQKHQGATALAPESRALLSLEAYVALQSRGLPIAPPDDPRLERLSPARQAMVRKAHRPAELLLRPMPRRQRRPAPRRQRHSRRRTRPATRSTGSSGRAWARCSGGCAAA